MRRSGISTRLSNLRGSFLRSAVRLTPSRVLVSALFSLGLLASTSALAQVENIQNGYAGADAGDWGGKKGAVIGPADDTCANMGAVDKVNLVSNFGFDIPSDATITEVRAFTKAGASSEQTVGVQLATNATVDPPVVIGDQVDFQFPDVGSGNCAVTVVSDVGNGLGFWGLGSLDPDDVNLPIFGMVFTKQETSEIKVDSICMQIDYETDTGPAVVEECFAEPPPETHTITVVKDLVGTPPGTDWAYTGDLGPFTLPAGGGFETFDEVQGGIYTITETTKPGYTVTSECLIDGVVVATGGASITVEVGADEVTDIATCIFANTLNVGNFTVSKDFSDNNTDPVLMTLTCSSGTIAVNPLPAVDGGPDAVFTINGFLPGATCTATEAATPGYDQDDSACQAGGLLADGGSCTMVNTVRTGIFTVHKSYDDANTTPVMIFASCTGGGSFDQNPLPAAPGDPAVFTYTGFAGDPTCSAVETGAPDGYVSNNDDCQDGDELNGSCRIINELIIIARFRVTKDFSDDDPQGVMVHIVCDTGHPLSNSFEIFDAPGSHVDFVVDSYEPGELDCTITEDPIPTGYDPDYTASLGPGGVAGSITGGDSCVFTDVVKGWFNCEIYNEAKPATFTVWKDWEIINMGGQPVLQEAEITIYCNNEIVGGDYDPIEEWWTLTDSLGDGGSIVATVDTTERPATCWATEEDYKSSGIETTDNCDSRSIPAGGSSECTFINTVFFEGIPTLSQYGLALMALLMLGIGMVGFRRFS
jgi:hypothetical protein